ncbi:MAG: class I SAM-dependent methyltransferase [Chitinophagaceae bacterium]|nr:class I SAM-dependent methyltransferase [Chitinophagaceae bacterium]MCA6464509.1 class I SAM-dependent methyltransferase [Chitinophagaceae bacterium]
MYCPVCNSPERSLLFKDTIESAEWILEGEHYDYCYCQHCGFIQSFPIPPEKAILKYYEEQYAYDWFAKNIFYKKIQAWHRFWKIRKYLNGAKRVLDFGCGHGLFVKEIARRGFASFGFDIGAEKISQGGNIFITNKNRLDEYEETAFDVITAWHVLEHMREQETILTDLYKRLNTGGTLIVAVPNTNSYAFKWLQQKWGWLQQPYVHINQYNSSNLAQLLKDHGFTICAISTTDTWDQNLYDVLISLFFYRNRSRNPIRTYQPTMLGNLFFRVNQILRLLFTPLSYLVSAIRSAKREGNELRIVAQKLT